MLSLVVVSRDASLHFALVLVLLHVVEFAFDDAEYM